MKKAHYFTPAVTAFDQDGNLDIPGNKNLWDHLIRGGVSGLIIMGSIGEFYSLNMEEKKRLIDAVTSHVAGRTRVYIGTGCMIGKETVELSNYALSAGADGVMVISPYYFNLSEESVENYYDQVADGVNGSLFLYNFPDRTGYDLSPAVTLRLLRKHGNIIGYKDTTGDMAHTRKLITTVSGEFPDFIVLSGFDEFFMHNLLCGGSGCIGGLSNIWPELFADWMAAADAKDLDRISMIQQKVDRFMKIYDVGPSFVPIIKAAVKLRGVEMENCCKRPFLEADGDQIRQIREILTDVGCPA